MRRDLRLPSSISLAIARCSTCSTNNRPDTTGVLVHKVDHSAQQKLTEELLSPSISTKLRGIEMAIAMEAADDVRQQLIELVGHENVAVRKEAVVALAHATASQSSPP